MFRVLQLIKIIHGSVKNLQDFHQSKISGVTWAVGCFWDNGPFKWPMGDNFL
jgi:hypothetical protein